jgi:hypothetical protein
MLRLTIQNNEGLTSIGSISQIVSIDNFDIRDNIGLTTLGNFPDLAYLGLSFIYDNVDLQNLNGLEQVNDVEAIVIAGNELLANFCSLENLVVYGNGAEQEVIDGAYRLDIIPNNAYNPTVEDIIAGNCSQ